MQNVDPKILQKIKKCLALSGSDNPHEAAAAMRQAKALMDKHNVAQSHITMSEIGEAVTKSETMSRDKPAQWETRLAGMVGRAFGCQFLVTKNVHQFRYENDGGYIFVGIKHQTEIASYTASVLIRKCKVARANYVKEYNRQSLNGRRRGASRAGDMFAAGWVMSIAKQVHAFANPPEVEQAINEYTKKAATSEEDAKVREVDKSKIGTAEILAARAGMVAAAGESLHRPMTKNGDSLMIAG